MNKIIIPLLLAFILSCTNQSNTGSKEGQEEKQGESKKVENLQLNDGKKWKLDSTTRANIADIKALVTEETPSDRKGLGDRLQQKTDELIQECRMKGPDHEALHRWLENYLLDLKKFRQAEATDSQSYVALQNDLRIFDDYFE